MGQASLAFKRPDPFDPLCATSTEMLVTRRALAGVNNLTNSNRGSTSGRCTRSANFWIVRLADRVAVAVARLIERLVRWCRTRSAL